MVTMERPRFVRIFSNAIRPLSRPRSVHFILPDVFRPIVESRPQVLEMQHYAAYLKGVFEVDDSGAEAEADVEPEADAESA
jgi:hypothetical protein